jgi:hypothetical protein
MMMMMMIDLLILNISNQKDDEELPKLLGIN